MTAAVKHREMLGALALSIAFLPVVEGHSSEQLEFPRPSIRAIVAPPPNSEGWNNTDVSIAFECRGVAACPDALVLTTEGAGQRVSRSVVSADGRTAEIAVIVNIDKTPGTVRIAETRIIGDTVLVMAYVDDPLSGAASAFCNGRPVPLSQGRIDCDVPYSAGLTDLAVSMLDRAGNSASTGDQLARDATSPEIHVFPVTATIRVGESRTLYLLDSAWKPVPDVSWSADDTSVVRLDPKKANATGLAEGRTTITASLVDGRTASTTLTVAPRGEFAPGTVIWRGHPLPGTVAAIALRPPPDGQSTMGTQVDSDGNLWVASLDLSGEPLWFTRTATSPGERVYTTMTDNMGNPILWVDAGHGTSAIVRTGRITKGNAWRYELQSSATGFWALGWDDTMWVVDTPPNGYPYVTAIDCPSGVTKFRVALPLTITAGRVDAAGKTAGTVAYPAGVGAPFVSDGLEVAIPYVITDIDPGPLENPSARAQARRRVFLLRVTPRGVTHSDELLGFTSDTINALPKLRLIETKPDNDEGMFVMMQVHYGDGRSNGLMMRRNGDTRSMYPLPVAGMFIVGAEQAFTTDGSTLVAFDPGSGKVNWVRQSRELIKLEFVTAEGGVVVQTPTGLYRVTRDGEFKTVLTSTVGDR